MKNRPIKKQYGRDTDQAVGRWRNHYRRTSSIQRSLLVGFVVDKVERVELFSENLRFILCALFYLSVY